MWLQLRLALLVGLMFSILYGIIAGLGYLLGATGYFLYTYLLAFAVLLVLIQYLVGPKLVEITMRVRYISEGEYPELHRMVEELAEEAGIPKPKLGISEIRIPNAFAFGRSKRDARVCVTRGILDLLDKEELRAVLGHEISHIKHRDVAFITVLSVVPMLCYFLYISFLWGGMRSRDRRENGVALFIGMIALIMYFITSLLVMYGSRIREYYADLGSVELGNQPSRLATALYKLVYGSAKMDNNTLKQAAGMKAFFLNDISQARKEISELREIDLDMSGTIDESELAILGEKKIKLRFEDRVLELLSTHPNMLKRIKHLADLRR